MGPYSADDLIGKVICEVGAASGFEDYFWEVLDDLRAIWAHHVQKIAATTVVGSGEYMEVELPAYISITEGNQKVHFDLNMPFGCPPRELDQGFNAATHSAPAGTALHELVAEALKENSDLVLDYVALCIESALVKAKQEG